MVFATTRTLATHVGAFTVGVAVTIAIAARADSPPPRDKQRYQALDTFAQSLSLIGSEYVVPTDDAALIYNAVRGMAAGLDDYSAFYDPERHRRVREDVGGEHGGVGILEARSPDACALPDHALIERVLPGSPAARAGIREGDRLVAVDGHDTMDPEVEKRVGGDFTRLLRGPLGTRVTVRVTRVDGDGPRELVLVREQLKVPSVEWFAADAGIGYVALSRFQEATTADLEAALRELDRGDVRVLILDLRDNPGGLVDQAVTVADLFIDRGTLVSIRGRAGMQPEVFVAHPERTVSRQRMIVLVDQDTASAAEIVASALQDHGRATIMGRSSHGKGSVQSFFDLADGSGLKLTTAYYYAPSGRALEHNGIVPDIEIEDFAADVIVAGPEASGPEGGGDLADGTTEAEPWAGHPAVPARLHDDHQFAVAYQTARAWLESKPGMPAAGPGKKSR